MADFAEQERARLEQERAAMRAASEALAQGQPVQEQDRAEEISAQTATPGVEAIAPAIEEPIQSEPAQQEQEQGQGEAVSGSQTPEITEEPVSVPVEELNQPEQGEMSRPTGGDSIFDWFGEAIDESFYIASEVGKEVGSIASDLTADARREALLEQYRTDRHREQEAEHEQQLHAEPEL